MRLTHDRYVDSSPNKERRRRAGEAIRSAREAAGLTQPEAAAALTEALRQLTVPGESQTVGQSAVSRWEIGSYAPQPWKLPVIEDVLGIPEGTLAGILYDRPPPAAQMEERLASIEAKLAAHDSTLAQILDAVTASDRRVRGPGK